MMASAPAPWDVEGQLLLHFVGNDAWLGIRGQRIFACRGGMEADHPNRTQIKPAWCR